MPNRKISELGLATSSLATDGLVIQRGGTNFRLEASNFSTDTADTGSLVTTSSITGTTITFTKGDLSTYTNEIISASHAGFAISASYAVTASHEVVYETSASYANRATSASHAVRADEADQAISASYAVSASLAQLALEAISSSYAISASHAEISDEAISSSYAITASHATSTAGTLSNGTSVDAFSFDGSTDVTVDISTYSASVSTDRTALSASLTTTDQTISSSVAALSGSASDARNDLAADYIAADTTLSASLTTTDQAISSSVATLSGSASDARNLLAADLDTISSSASTARDVLASQVSGAFAADSASFSTRVTTLEEFSSSLDATYATDAELNAATASLSSSLTTTDQAISSSVALLSGSASDARNALSGDFVLKAGDTMTGPLSMSGNNILLGNGGGMTSDAGAFIGTGPGGATLQVNGGSADAFNFVVRNPDNLSDFLLSVTSSDGGGNTVLGRDLLAGSNQIKDVADPTEAQDAATKAYVDNNSNTTGSDGQTIRFEGTTQVANSVLYNKGSQVAIGNTSPKAGYALTVTNQDNAADHRLLVGRTDAVGGTQDYLELRSTGNTGYLEVRNDLVISSSKDGGGADTSIITGGDITLNAVGGDVYNSSKQIKAVADPTAAQDAATKNYVDNSTAVGTNAQTLRFNGTTLEASSLLTNDGSQISIGNAAPNAQDALTVTDGMDTRVRIGRTDLSPDRDFLEIRSNFLSGSIISSNEHLVISASNNTGTANIQLNPVGGATYNSNKQIKDVADPTAAQDAATKNYVDVLSGSASTARNTLAAGLAPPISVVGAAWDSGTAAQTMNQGKWSFNLNSSRQVEESDATQATFNTTNNEWILKEGTWEISADLTKTSATLAAARFFHIRFNTTAGSFYNAGTAIDDSDVTFTTTGNQKVIMHAILTVPASATRYVWANFGSGNAFSAKHQKMTVKKIA